MNRRELLKALVGGAVVALVPTLPRAEEELDVAALQASLAGIAHGAKDMTVCLQELAASSQAVADWGAVWRHDWVTSMAQTIDDEMMNS